jgi:hypothetical protein
MCLKKVIRKFFGPKKVEARGQFRILHIEDIRDFTYHPCHDSEVYENAMGRTYSSDVETSKAYRIFVGKLFVEWSLRRSKRKQDANFEMNQFETGCEDGIWSADLNHDHDHCQISTKTGICRQMTMRLPNSKFLEN